MVLEIVLVCVAALVGVASGVLLAKRKPAPAPAPAPVPIPVAPRVARTTRETADLVCPVLGATCPGESCAWWSTRGSECMLVQSSLKMLSGEPGDSLGSGRARRKA
jgi:hypothetical protein